MRSQVAHVVQKLAVEPRLTFRYCFFESHSVALPGLELTARCATLALNSQTRTFFCLLSYKMA